MSLKTKDDVWRRFIVPQSRDGRVSFELNILNKAYFKMLFQPLDTFFRR